MVVFESLCAITIYVALFVADRFQAQSALFQITITKSDIHWHVHAIVWGLYIRPLIRRQTLDDARIAALPPYDLIPDP